DAHPTSMGTAIPFAEILVINDAGERAKADEEGELVHCGPLVAHGYWQDPERTAERFKPAPNMSEYGGMAVYSGDRVKRADNGLLYFVGRRDAMIKSAGNRISPAEVEEAALASGLVAEVIALGIPDERLGHAVHLVVRAEPGHADDSKALAKALAKELPNFMHPKHYHWKAAMPLNPNGKIDRTALYQEITA
ncbi:MAG: fatty acid--CoA ligase family protein, partial [Marinomonas sp.]